MKTVLPVLFLLALCLFSSDARLNVISGVHGAHSLRPLLVDSPTQPQNNATKSKYFPIVVWHGMGDSCCADYSIGAVIKYIQSLVPEGEIFIHSIATGHNEAADISSSYFGLVDDQVDRVCDEIRAIPELQHGYTAVGFSQGGQFLRAVVQRCQHRGPVAHTLVTMGAQHEGIMDIPGCWEPSFNSTPSYACRAVQKLLAAGAYNRWIQNRVIQAQYFKDPLHLDTYYRNSAFLADINAEALPRWGGDASFPTAVGKNKLLETEKKAVSARYDLYKNNLSSLQRLVLFMFDNDITVVPKESAHFGFFDGEKLVPLIENKIYTEDRLGLKALDESGRLVIAHAPGFHMQFSLEWFFENVVEPYLLVEIDT
jgi:palmitoyl-protein thioesterase